MNVPLEIVYRNVQKTEELEQGIREKVDKLERICGYMSSCRVAVERNQKFQRSGNPYRVLLEIGVPPGHRLVVDRDHQEHDTHEPLNFVIKDAFAKAERQLKALKSKQHRDVKAHPAEEANAVVAKLFPEKGYGFVETIEGGHQVYFHRNSVLRNDFDRLNLGAAVRVALVEEGEEGLQATSVELVGRTGQPSAEFNGMRQAGEQEQPG